MECLYPTALCGILLARTTYGPPLSSKHGPGPRARQCALVSRRNTEEGAQLSHLPCCRGGFWEVSYAEETCLGLVLCRFLCHMHIFVPGKFTLQTSQSHRACCSRGDIFSEMKAFSIQVLHCISSKHRCAPTHTHTMVSHGFSCPTW